MELLYESFDRATTLSRGHVRVESSCDCHVRRAVVCYPPQMAEQVSRCLGGRMATAPVEEPVDRVSWLGVIIRRRPNRGKYRIAIHVGESGFEDEHEEHWPQQEEYDFDGSSWSSTSMFDHFLTNCKAEHRLLTAGAKNGQTLVSYAMALPI